MGWPSIVGQKKAVELLRADLEAGRVAESYLFCGPRGVGKRTVALELAKSLNCLGPQDAAEDEQALLFGAPGPAPRLSAGVEACDACASCRKIGAGGHADVFTLDFESQAQLLELDDDARSRQKEYRIDAVRMLVSRAHLSAVEARKKVFIIDGAEGLNQESANALLKVVEEAPRDCHWILLASGAERVLATIRSRCRKVQFAPLAPGEVFAVLAGAAAKGPEKEEKKRRRPAPDQETLRRAAEICDGSAAGALALTDPEALELQVAIDRLLSSADAAPGPLLVLSAGLLSDARRAGPKKRAEQFLGILVLRLAADLRSAPSARAAAALSAALEAQEELRRNAGPQMVLDSLLLSIAAR